MSDGSGKDSKKDQTRIGTPPNQRFERGVTWREKLPLSLFISFIALVFSVLTGYYSVLAPPDIKGYIGEPMWVPVETSNLDGEQVASTVQEHGIVLTCSFTNTGAGTGVVEDVVLRVVQSGADKPKLYYPAYVLDTAKMFKSRTLPLPTDIPRSTTLQVTIPDAVVGKFQPVTVAGRQSTAFTYQFKLVHGVGFDTSGLAPGNYEITILTRMAGSNDWVSGEKATTGLAAEDFNIINRHMVLESHKNEDYSERAKIK